MFPSYLAGEGHEDSETGQVSAIARDVTLVHLFQGAAVPGPVAALLRGFPEDTHDVFARGLHQKTERAYCVFAQEEQPSECQPSPGWGVRAMAGSDSGDFSFR